MKSPRCLHFSLPGTTIYTLIVQCWLKHWGWWQVTNGTRPCTSCLQSWICSVFLEHAWRDGILSSKQFDLTVKASIPLPVYLWPGKYLPVQSRNTCPGESERCLHQPSASCSAGREDWGLPSNSYFKNQPKISYISGQGSELCKGPEGGWRRLRLPWLRD